MNWINIHTSTLRSPEFIGSAPIDRATWLCVLAYAAEQENGGVLQGAALWKDRQWQQTCGVTAREVKMAFKLLKVDGENVVVAFYPMAKEEIVRQKREIASAGGKAKALANAKANAKPDANGDDVANAPAEGNRREGKGIPPIPPKGGGERKAPTSEPAKRIAELFGRRESTGWSDKEIKAFKSLGNIDQDELATLEAYHLSEKAKGESGRHRRDLYTFLNNFRGEIDRAKAWKNKWPILKPAPQPANAEIDPVAFAQWASEFSSPPALETASDRVKEKFLRETGGQAK